jgi:hypothetical protein
MNEYVARLLVQDRADRLNDEAEMDRLRTIARDDARAGRRSAAIRAGVTRTAGRIRLLVRGSMA